jgi:hypothetical protein
VPPEARERVGPAERALASVLEALGGRTLLEALRERVGVRDLLHHWKQGEFHHDLVFAVPEGVRETLGRCVVASTNCNGGVKELLALADVPTRWALWRARCPDNPAFEGELPEVLGRARSVHWFDPCLLLAPDARSELRPDARVRQRGGGWMPLDDDEETEAQWRAART